MFINIYRNPKTRNWSGKKILFTFSGLRFFDKRRETQFLSMLSFPSAPTTCGTFRRPPTGLASASPKNQLAPSKSETQLQLSQPTRGARRLALPRSESQLTLFFFKSPNSSVLPGMTSFTSPVLFPICFFFLCDISDCHIRPARVVNTCTQLTYVH